MIDRYAVFGNPIAHSKSPIIHSTFAQDAGHTLEYTKILAPLDGFKSTMREFIASGGKGANITAPFKLEAFDIATKRSERAALAGAANALKFEGDTITAENFDGVGLVNDVQRNLGVSIKGKRILMLGAGGAARGAILPFLAEQPAQFVLVNRHLDKAQGLVQQFSAMGNIEAAGYGDLANSAFDLVLNATSASLTGELPAIRPSVFAQDSAAYELVYGKGLTPFLRLAQTAGVTKVADGVGMLVEQAAEAFAWWRGVRPETRPVISALTIPLI
jgi:shikimate dehydrogenase